MTRTTLILGVVAAVAGCGNSVTVEGRLLHPDGTPAADVPLQVFVGEDFDETSTTTGSDGCFSMTIPRPPPEQPPNINAYYGPSTTVIGTWNSLFDGESSVELPDVTLWDPAMAITTSRDGLTWQPVVCPAGYTVSYDVGYYESQRDYLRVDVGDVTSATIDARIFQDFHDGAFNVRAHLMPPVRPPGDTTPPQILIRHVAMMLPFDPGSPIPLSRGADCSAYGEPLVPCPFTDGALFPSWDADELEVDLGAVEEITAVTFAYVSVLYDNDVVVEVSSDGVSYSEIGTLSIPWWHGSFYGYLAARAAPAVEARYVRLRAVDRDGDSLSFNLGEIGVY